jgi:hypothetical protein
MELYNSSDILNNIQIIDGNFSINRIDDIKYIPNNIENIRNNKQYRFIATNSLIPFSIAIVDEILSMNESIFK